MPSLHLWLVTQGGVVLAQLFVRVYVHAICICKCISIWMCATPPHTHPTPTPTPHPAPTHHLKRKRGTLKWTAASMDKSCRPVRVGVKRKRLLKSSRGWACGGTSRQHALAEPRHSPPPGSFQRGSLTHPRARVPGVVAPRLAACPRPRAAPSAGQAAARARRPKTPESKGQSYVKLAVGGMATKPKKVIEVASHNLVTVQVVPGRNSPGTANRQSKPAHRWCCLGCRL